MTDLEASTISSPDCDVPFSSFIAQTWVKFDPAFDKLTERKWRKRLEDSEWRTGLDVVFLGKFESTRHDGIRGFGHQDMYGARLVVMSAEQVQPLGKFSTLPSVAPESETALSNALPQLTLCEALKPSADQTPLIRVTATLDVLKEMSLLRDRDCPDQHAALAEFSTYWRASTRPDAAKVIDQKRKRSGTRWPYRGLNSLEVQFESLDVVLEGFLISNPFHKDSAELDITSELTSQYRAGPEMVFFVQRVISAREPKKARP